MPTAMINSEVIEDGQGNDYVLQLYPKRAEIVRRNRLGEIKAVGSAFGPGSAEVARFWSKALVARAKGKSE